ncbi:hypothetical protein OIDMADRAFT_29037 [Oidiodendron maius Zn]|uniref:Uncharacterized protein n=1 Tax=Oidiodendron maius (strain Zn) TaxID=913774 RepID=A0A0C3CQQ3_OIDMZ|nr:hypothetical protein OIDMADRAFT_29037 [Oidiodendron maius Zn]
MHMPHDGRERRGEAGLAPTNLRPFPSSSSLLQLTAQIRQIIITARLSSRSRAPDPVASLPGLSPPRNNPLARLSTNAASLERAVPVTHIDVYGKGAQGCGHQQSQPPREPQNPQERTVIYHRGVQLLGPARRPDLPVPHPPPHELCALPSTRHREPCQRLLWVPVE